MPTPLFGLPLYGDSDTAELDTLLNGQSTALETALDTELTAIRQEFAPVVANAAARDSYFPSPTAGDRVYRLDTNLEQVYRGGAWKNQPSRTVSVQVQKNVVQTLGAGPTSITWNSVGAQHDSDSFYSTGANTRLTAPFDGIYRVSFTLYSNSASSIIVTSYPYKNGSSLGFGTAPARNGVSGAAVGVTNTFLVALAAGDYLEIRPVVTSPTGNWDTGGACVFGMEYLGEI